MSFVKFAPGAEQIGDFERFASQERPEIGIVAHYVYFNEKAVSEFSIEDYTHVNLFFDSNNNKIGINFTNDPDYSSCEILFDLSNKFEKMEHYIVASKFLKHWHILSRVPKNIQELRDKIINYVSNGVLRRESLKDSFFIVPLTWDEEHYLFVSLLDEVEFINGEEEVQKAINEAEQFSSSNSSEGFPEEG